MRSAEILFRFTVFEEFLKHVQELALRSDLSILSKKPHADKQAKYSDIFSNGYESFTEFVLAREIQQLEYAPFKDKADYFKTNFTIEIPHLKELSVIKKLRNKIAHGNPIEAITVEDVSEQKTDQTKSPGKILFPLDDVEERIASFLSKSMRSIFEQAAKRYPKVFLRTL